VIKLVERNAPAAGVPELSIASAARSALAADAVVIVDLSAPRLPRVAAADGLSEPELARVVSDCRAAPGAGDFGRAPGFPVALFREARVAEVGAAAIFALQRNPRGFRNTPLARAFAQHALVSSGIRRHARRHGQSPGVDGAISTLGVWSLGETDYGELNAAIADELAGATGARCFGVLFWDERAQLLRPVPGAFGSDPDVLPPAHDARDWGSSAVRVFATGEPYLSNDAAADPAVLQDYVEAFGLTRLMTLPMNVGSKRIGVLQVANKPTSFTIADLVAAEAHARRIACGVQVVRMRQALIRRQRLERTLGGVAVDIASGRSLQDFLEVALNSLCATVQGSMIMLVPRIGEPMILRRSPDCRDLEQITLAHARQATSLNSFGVGPRRAGALGWAEVHVPVVLNGEQVATVAALRRGGELFDHDECEAFARLANLLALAWTTERYQRQLAEKARVTERQRIADELHDQVAQLLFAARLSLDQAIEMPAVPDQAALSVRRGRDLVLRADAATRQVMQQLSQATEEGLGDRLTALVGGVEEEFGRPVQLEIERPAVDAARRIGRPAMNLLARAAREALVNAVKHAGPCQLAVRVSVTRRNRLLLTVTDDGIGVADRRDEGYGTVALRRAVRREGGVLRMGESATGGTKMAVSLPI
jgi:signal transduction histidine kinase